MGNEAPEALRASSEPAEKEVFQEFGKHLLIVYEAAAALLDRKTCLEARATNASPPKARAVTVLSQHERWTSREPASGFDLQFFVVERYEGELQNRIFREVRWVNRHELPTLDFLDADRTLVQQIAEGKLL